MENRSSNLVIQNNYPDDYLEFLKEIGLILPGLLKSHDSPKFWWGTLKDLKMERYINSKATSAKIAIENGWAHPSTEIIFSKNDWIKIVSNHSDNFEFFLREAFSVSGRGCHSWCKQKINKNLEKIIWEDGVVVEPKLDRVLDFGVLINDSGLDYWINWVGPRGKYIGGIYSKDKEKLLENFFPSDCRDFFPSYKKIFSEYKKLGNIEKIQVDSFLFLEDGNIKPYVLSEVNHRKTMGEFLLSLNKFSPELGFTAVIFNEKKYEFSSLDMKGIIQILEKNYYNKDTKVGILPLSPYNIPKASFLLSYHSKDEVMEAIEFLNQNVFKKPLKTVI